MDLLPLLIAESYIKKINEDIQQELEIIPGYKSDKIIHSTKLINDNKNISKRTNILSILSE